MAQAKRAGAALIAAALLGCGTPRAPQPALGPAAPEPGALGRTGPPASRGPVEIQLLAFNDFHGHLARGRSVGGRPAGGAAVLAAHLVAARRGREDGSFIVHAGDHVGASPPESALAQDEPAIGLLNLLGNARCGATRRLDPGCDVVGAAGNHEFDEGKAELLRLLGGGVHGSGSFLETPWPGASYPTLAANVIDEATGAPVLPAAVVKGARGVRIGFIGAVVTGTPAIIPAHARAGLRFLDEAEAINGAAAALVRGGVRALVVLIHQGGRQAPYEGPTRRDAPPLEGAAMRAIVDRLDDEIDVVVSGHAHAFTNALVPNARGKELLVTQAFSGGTAYAAIDLTIDPHSGDVVGKSARIVTAWADEGPGRTPEPRVAALVAAAEARVAPLVSRRIAVAAAPIGRKESAAGESPLGNLVADAQRAAVRADFAFMNPGGLRADLPAGPVTWGDLFAVHPFGNAVTKLTMTGTEVMALLEEQWRGGAGRVLKISGLSYVWDPRRQVGRRIIEARTLPGGRAIDPAATYTVAVNDYLVGGGDGFSGFARGRDVETGPLDLDALAAHLTRLRGPVRATIEGRIRQAK